MTQPSDRPFGELLRLRRLDAGLTQAVLAERAGLSLDAIRALERGRRGAPRAETVGRLATALGLRPHQLLATAPTPQSPGAESAEEGSSGAAQEAPLGRHNLPAASGDLVGRQEERAQLRTLLGETRLLTLVGPGGIGKSRLALAVAGDLLATYPDGVWLVELAALADPRVLPQAVAQALRLREAPGQPILATLAAHLVDRRLLLVLDNCEHLLAACAELAATLLARCPHLRILATSREGLAVRGEQRYRVSGLSVPDVQRLPPPALVERAEAVQLFVARARAHWPEFVLSVTNAPAVAEVCARLEGIPLAIELAAARVGLLSPAAIAARLDERFRLLTGGPRDAPSRQQTLRATMDWSWGLLSGHERALLRRLAVFAGGWTLAAAEAMCVGEGVEPWLVLDGLQALVEKSLVGPADEAGAARYRLLETVRQYAEEQLRAAGEATAVRDRHLGWCLALAETAEPHLHGAEQGVWLARLEAEHDNLRTALAWARVREAGEEGLRLSAALAPFWHLRGHLHEGQGWLEAALAGAGMAAPELRAKALREVGTLASMQSEYERAATAYAEALALYRERDDRPGIAQALGDLATVAFWRTDYARAAALCDEALALHRRVGEKRGIARALIDLGWCLIALQGDHGRLAAVSAEALAVYQELEDRWGSGEALFLLGHVACQQGDYVRALALHEEGLALRREVGNMAGMAASLIGLALAAYKQGEYGRAATLVDEGLLVCRDIGFTQLQVSGLEIAAWLSLVCEQYQKAALLAGAADAVGEASGAPLQLVLRVDHDLAVTAMRAHLGDDAFAAAWSAGRALSLEAAIAVALEDGPVVGGGKSPDT